MSQKQACPQCGKDMKRTETKDGHGALDVFSCAPCGVSYFEAPPSRDRRSEISTKS
jgi:predicted RNA-binding Zn-ribbon protein involved in translation (DUF1610 family)